MHTTILSILLFSILTTTGAVPQRLKPQCRSKNVCDDRPQCPISSCNCIFPSGMDCAIYYQCINGKPYQYRCSPGLLFNENTLSCDYSYNVNCSISTTTSTTVTITDPPITNETTKEHVTTKTTESFTTTEIPEKQTTTKATEVFSTGEAITTNKPTTTEKTQGPTTVKTTERPTTTKVTEEPTTSTQTTKDITTVKTVEPTTAKTTAEIITTQTTKQSTTTKQAEETTTGKTTVEFTTEMTTTTEEPTTFETTENPFTTKITTTETSKPTTTEEITTTQTSKPTTIEEVTTTQTSKSTTTETISPEITPTINSSSDFLCPTRFGLFPDPENCSRFYHCSHWIAYHKWCPSDLHFNPELEVCDWPYRAGCALSTIVSTQTMSTITEETTTSKATDDIGTTKTSIHTSSKTTNEPTTIKTTENPTTTKITEYSIVTETTKGPTTKELTSLPTVQSTSAETTKVPTTTKAPEPTTTKVPESTTEEPKTTKEPTTTKLPESTTEEPKTTKTLPSTTMQTTKQSPTIQTTEPIVTKTEKSTTVETEVPTTAKITEESTTITATPEPSSVKTTQEPTTIKPTQEAVTTKTTEKTMTIETEKPTSIETASPTVTKLTNKPTTFKSTEEPTTPKSTAILTTKNSVTTQTIETVTATETTTKIPTTEKITETTSPSGIETSSAITPPSDFLCPSRFGLFPDPKNCFRFYHCSHWIPYHKWCPSNLHFNPKLKVCDWPYRAGCGTIWPTPTPENPPTSNPNDTYGTCDCDCCELPVPGDCNAYMLCIDKVAFIQRCSPGLYFNPMTATCDYKENVDCDGDDFTCPAQSGRYLLPGSCSYFIECHGGKKTIRKCPEGLQFNQSSEMCSWLGTCADQQPDDDAGSAIIEDNAVCDGCYYCFRPYTKDCSRYARCQQSVATEGQCAAGLFFNSATEMCDHDYNVECPEPRPPLLCPQTFGYFPYPGECGMYLECINGVANVKHCPGILHFDPGKKHCDYPWTAGCDSDSLPTPAPTKEFIECDCDCCLKPVGTDCRSFVICINKVGLERSCASGLFYNPQTENCDFAENVNCSISPEIPGYLCPERQGLFPHPDDCDKFIHCDHGIPHVKDCPSDLHFNPALKVCDWPYSAGCQGLQPTGPPVNDDEFPCDVCDSCFMRNEDDCAVYIYCHDGKGRKFRCAENLYFNTETESCDLAANVKCPNEPSSECLKPEGLFPTNDCSQFIQCSNGIAYLKDCPDGLLFNPQMLVCDWPENVKCGEIPVLPTPSDDDSDTSNVTCNCDCCFLPYGKDCSKYILCLDGHAHVGQCSRGLLFNPEIQNCDLAERVKCGQQPPSCPEPNGLFPKQGQCSSYLKCSGGTAEVEYCRNGTHFSSDMKQCTDPCKAKCDSNYDCTTKPEVVSTSPTPTICLEPDGFYPVPNDCGSFYVCSNGQPQHVNCPNGLHYNVEYEVCEDPCDAQCDHKLDCVSTSGTSPKTTPSSIRSSTTADPQCLQGDGRFLVKDDCSSFYQCSNGKGYLMKCPPGLHFNYRLQSCDYPCEAKCNSSLDCSTTGSGTTGTSIMPTDPHCRQGNGFYPVKDNCSSFYQCSNGKAHLMNCSSGLHFSPKHKTCEYPCTAKCNSSIDCSSTTSKPISTPSPHCPSPNGQYPISGDCTAFYICSNGKEYEIPCPPGLHYSERDEICENPCIAQCNKSLDCKTTTSSPLSSTTPHSISPECDEPDGLFPNPSDCGSFYQCSHGRSYLMHCPDGLHFSLDDSACEQPCVAGCDLNIECPPEIPDPKGNCTCDSCFLPDPSDCSALYRCQNGKLTKGYCPYGKLFSKKTLRCEDESIVDCESKGDPSMCPKLFGFFPYPGDCTQFVHCDNGVAHIQQCKEGLEYDPQSSVCTKPKGYCGDPVQDPNCPKPTGLFPDPTNCSSFYHCEHGVAYHKQCSPPLVFNPNQEVCDWPKNVACGNSTTDVPTSSVNPFSSTLSPSSSSTPTSSACYEVAGVICPCACRVPSYDECSSYYQCQEDGTACKRFCPEGLYFNKVEMVCDLPENVKCRDFFYTSLRRAKRLGHLLDFSPTKSSKN